MFFFSTRKPPELQQFHFRKKPSQGSTYFQAQGADLDQLVEEGHAWQRLERRRLETVGPFFGYLCARRFGRRSSNGSSVKGDLSGTKWLQLSFSALIKDGQVFWPNGIIFHQPIDFPEIAKDFPYNHHHLGEIGRVRSL